MLVTKEVEVTYSGNNIKYYTELGFAFKSKKEKIMVPIEKLSPKSAVPIKLKCDYCGKEFPRKYSDHTLIIGRDIVNKDSCKECRDFKSRDVLEYKQKNGMLTKESNGYWTFKENRLKELDSYTKNHGTVDGIYSLTSEGRTIWYNFFKNNHSLIDAINELGYDLHTVMTKMTSGYYDDFENLSNRINFFVNTYGKFPTQQEMRLHLNLEQMQIQKHGGIYEVKRKMEYSDENDLKDDNGFYNGSSYEYCVAQYLIHNTDIKYLREQYPFPKTEGLYRSDFSFTLENGETIQVEVWGGNGKTKYEEVKAKKLFLYMKYNIKVISIEASVFNLKMDSIQSKLYNIFNPYINLKTIKIDGSLLCNYSTLSDEQLLNLIMEYSNNSGILPSSKHLKNIGQYKLYSNASKRYGSYREFGIKMGVTSERKNQGFWTLENLFLVAYETAIQGIGFSQNDLRKRNLNDLENAICHYQGGLMQFRLDFYEQYALDLPDMNTSEIKFILNVASNKGINIKNRVSSKQMEKAKLILSQLNTVINKSVS